MLHTQCNLDKTMKKTTKPKRVKLSTLQNKADGLMSLYVRQKFAKDGYCNCVSCGKSLPWQEMDCGHFVPKSRGAAVRWVEENVAPECPGCNRFDEGHLIGYTLWVIDWYGQDMIDHLKRESRKVLTHTQKRQLAEEAIEYYKTALAELNQ